MKTLSFLLASLLAFPSTLLAQTVIAPIAAPIGASGAAGAAGGAAGQGSSFTSGPTLDVPTFPSTWRGMADSYRASEAKLLSDIANVLSIPKGERAFGNTVAAFERAYSDFRDATNPASFMTAVSPDKRVQRMAGAIDKRIAKLMIELGDRDDIYQAYKDAAAKGETLTGEDKKLLEESLRGYARSGMDLAPELRARLNAVRQRLSKLSLAFDENLRKVDDGIEVTREELDGLPEDFINGLADAPDGKKRVTLKYPDYIPFMELAKNGDARRRLEFKYNNRAVTENLPLLEETLTLRQELSRLLGYRNYAHYATELRMARSPEKVQNFLQRLRDLVFERAQSERKALLDEKRRDVPDAAKLDNWESSYYAHKLQKRLYDFDPEETRPYFPVDRVVSGTLEVYQQTLGLVFREVPNAGAWHQDAKLFAVSDKASGRKIGHFFLDLHPRLGKYGHAAAFTVIQGRELSDGTYRLPVSAMVTNFTKPTAEKPALLQHDEVETFFHEFGHIMHQVLTQARYSSFSGTSVALDFVEAPSQMMENFVWRPEVLEKISGHFQDPSRKLPPELLAKMLAAKNFNAAVGALRQAALASIDLAYHTLEAPMDTTEVMRRVIEAIGVSPPTPGTHFQASFGHIMHGYESGYYGYLWSRVFAQDIWSRFEAEGPLNPATGLSYRRLILERGSSVAEAESLAEFLGRQPNEEAFLRYLGFGKPVS